MDVLMYSACEQAKFDKVLAECGYKTFTTFFGDLSIAECYGKSGILDTHKRVCESWIGDYKYFTEYVMALNHKCWEWSDLGKHDLSAFYQDLFYKAQELYEEHYKDNKEALSYYYRVTD